MRESPPPIAKEYAPNAPPSTLSPHPQALLIVLLAVSRATSRGQCFLQVLAPVPAVAPIPWGHLSKRWRFRVADAGSRRSSAAIALGEPADGRAER